MPESAATLTPDLAQTLESFNQSHVLRFWDDLNDAQRKALAHQLAGIDFELVQRLVNEWVRDKPDVQPFQTLEPAKVHPPCDADHANYREAVKVGEKALADGRVGFLLVAGGQGTRLGFDGPKGSFPAGPITGRPLFAYFADRIRAVSKRFDVQPPWYIMVGEQNEAATKAFFAENDHFGIDAGRIFFFKQDMMPCVDEDGRFLLEEPHRLATNPNGHGGVIPAFVQSGLLDDAKCRGVDTLHYFQVDNYAIQLGDPCFIGLHIQNDAEISAKVARKQDPRESAGTFCVCDGTTRVIEYTEVDLYPQLLDTDAEGRPVHFAANTAIHVLSTRFIERIHDAFDHFPWHCSHKKIPYIDETGARVEPQTPNGYKFETFIFDSLAYCERPPVLLEIPRTGEFAPIKQPEGPGSVVEARANMRRFWGGWLKAAGFDVPEDVDIEISPLFANSREEFVEKAKGRDWRFDGPISIGPDGELGWKG